MKFEDARAPSERYTERDLIRNVEVLTRKVGSLSDALEQGDGDSDGELIDTREKEDSIWESINQLEAILASDAKEFTDVDYINLVAELSGALECWPAKGCRQFPEKIQAAIKNINRDLLRRQVEEIREPSTSTQIDSNSLLPENNLSILTFGSLIGYESRTRSGEATSDDALIESIRELLEDNQEDLIDRIFEVYGKNRGSLNSYVLVAFLIDLLNSDVFASGAVRESLINRLCEGIKHSEALSIEIARQKVKNLPIEYEEFKSLEDEGLGKGDVDTIKEATWRDELQKDPILRNCIEELANKMGLQPFQSKEMERPKTPREQVIDGWLENTPALASYEQYEASTMYSSAKEFMARDISRVFSMEATHPGSVKELHKRFGIQSFGRYPEAQLLHQYEHADDAEMRYGMVIYPRTDWNGAFYNDEIHLAKIHHQLTESEWGGLRVAEVASGKGAYKRLKQFDNQYRKASEDGQPISFLILGGHGNTEKTTLGPHVADWNRESSEEARDHAVTKASAATVERHRATLQNRAAANRIPENWLNNVFAPEATLILFSCSTGAYRGLAEHLVRAGRIKTAFAPTAPTSPESVLVTIEDDVPRFRVKYRDVEREIGTIDPTRRISQVPEEEEETQ